MDVSNATWMVASGFAAASCCFSAAAYWKSVRRRAADAKRIRKMVDDECADWVFERYGYLVDGHKSLTPTQKLEVIGRTLAYEAADNRSATIVIVTGVALAVGIVAYALSK